MAISNVHDMFVLRKLFLLRQRELVRRFIVLHGMCGQLWEAFVRLPALRLVFERVSSPKAHVHLL